MSNHAGFILTSHIQDSSSGISLVYFGQTSEHSFKLVFDNQRIVFFVPKAQKFDPPNISFERKSSQLKHFGNEDVDIIYLSKFRDLQTVKEYCEYSGIRTFELDIRPEERFLMERFIYGEVEFRGEAQVNNFGVHVYKNPEIAPSLKSSPISIMSVDIETGVDGSLYSLAYEFRKQGRTKQLVIMRDDQDSNHDDWLTYVSSERKIITLFLAEVQKLDPAIICGWHVIGFDLVFLEKKCSELNIPFNLGQEESNVSLFERKGAGFFANMKGRVVIDGPPVLRSAFFKFSDFKLETVAQEVLGTGKDIDSDSGKVDEIERRFREDKLGLAKYNLLDSTLVLDIFEELQIMELLHKRVTLCGLLIDRLALSTAAFDFLYLPKLHRMGFVAPNRIEILREDASTGGLVIEPKAGLHENVAIFDFKSLYPTLMMTFKIDPLGRMLGETSDDVVTTPTDHRFDNKRHILPELLSSLMDQRSEAKQARNKPLSQAIKILMNSFYGILGSVRCRFYHSDLPDAITQTGHYILKEAMAFFDSKDLEVIYGDTDSIFVKFPKDVEASEQARYARELNLILDKKILETFKVESKLECEFEKNFSKIYFSKMRSGSGGGAKKRYVGITKGKIEFTGMEVVRSDWTKLAKIFQTQIYENFFNNIEITNYIKVFIKDLEAGLYDDCLVYTKRLSKPPSEYTKNIPIHVKAALLINHTGPYRLKQVSYVVTKSGPIPIENNPGQFDYNHYIEKQLKPIADDVLSFQNTSFDSIIIGDQLSLI